MQSIARFATRVCLERKFRRGRVPFTGTNLHVPSASDRFRCSHAGTIRRCDERGCDARIGQRGSTPDQRIADQKRRRPAAEIFYSTAKYVEVLLNWSVEKHGGPRCATENGRRKRVMPGRRRVAKLGAGRASNERTGHREERGINQK